MIRAFLTVTTAAVLLASCKQEATVPDKAVKGDFVTYKDVVYGKDSVDQSVDVHLPKTGNKRPVFILLHGGAWAVPGKFDFDGLGLDTFFTYNGYAVVNMNYRLIPKYTYPAAVDDIGLVMDLVRKKATEWNLDPDRVCLLGRSSGAHLALLYAYSRNDDKRIKAVIDYCGPVDFTDSTVAYAPLGANVAALLGPYQSHTQVWHDASPINYLAGAVPTVILQGTNDSLVFPVQSQLLQNGLLHLGVPCMYISCQGDGHGWRQDRWVEWRDATLQWLKYFL
jgi:acetyl esterase/lipase